MTSIAPPIRGGCAHLFPAADDRGALFDPKCAAFPSGIPTDILLSHADHRSSFTGDDGVRFAPQDADAAAYADFLFGTDPSRTAPASGD